MLIEKARILLVDDKATVGQLLDVLTWLAKDISRLRDRGRWIQESASQESVIALDEQIAEEIREGEALIHSLKAKVQSKCTN